MSLNERAMDGLALTGGMIGSKWNIKIKMEYR
jgi:hypothetical protein